MLQVNVGITMYTIQVKCIKKDWNIMLIAVDNDDFFLIYKAFYTQITNGAKFKCNTYNGTRGGKTDN